MPPTFIDDLARFFRRAPKTQVDAPTAPARPDKITFGVGALIDQRYRLYTELGRGGMGVVYRARDYVDERDVAIKVVNLAKAGIGGRELFMQEAQITERLHHPHIVAVYATGMVDTGASEPSPYIVMEFVPGRSLSEFHGLAFTQIIDIARQICDALEYAHGQGLIHRDLKPENVLVEKQGYRYVAKLMDFGLARPRGAIDLDQSNVVGTVYYLAPEVIDGQPADLGADLYALGVMLYEMVTGRVPFSDFDSQSILFQHLKESVTPPSHSRTDIPPALEAIILRLLAKDPRERFASAREVSQALDQIVAGSKSIVARNRLNLPQLLTSFTGRDNAIAQAASLFESHRFITLTGAGGIGKTRLAFTIGDVLSEQFADGVWCVDLAPWRDPAMLPEIVATVLGVREEPRRALMVSLTENLREKNLLLILDHCDHLASACAQFIDTILRTCSNLRVLATSRQPLNLADEKIFPVPALSIPAATQLLIDRVGAAIPASQLESPVVARLGQRLGCIPLAIELVAARSKTFSLTELDEQLKKLGLDDETPLLPEQTIRAVIAWSHNLLAEPAQTLFRRLSVFVGSFTLASVESFGGAASIDPMRLLAQLVDASLIETNSSSGDARYRMSEPIRQFAAEKLHAAEETESTRRNHRDGFLLLAMQAAQNLHGIEQGIWRKRLENEYANLITAIDWTIERSQDTFFAFRFGGALWQFWNERGYSREGRNRLEKILQLPRTPTDAPARIGTMIGAGYLATAQTDYTSAQSWLDQALATAREIKDQTAEAYALCGLGSLAQVRGDFANATKLYHDGWERFRLSGNAWEKANALYNLAVVNLRQGDAFGAQSMFTASLEGFRQAGDQRGVAQALSNLGALAYDRQQFADAEAFFEDALAVWRGLYDKFGMANQLYRLGFVALHQSRWADAHQYFAEGLTVFKELNNRRQLADGLVGVAGVMALRQPERAAQLIGAADALLQAPGTSIETATGTGNERQWVLERIALNGGSLQAAFRAGHALSLEQALARAMESL